MFIVLIINKHIKTEKGKQTAFHQLSMLYDHDNTEILKYHYTINITTKCNDCLVYVQIITQTATVKAIKQQRKLGVTKR